MTTQSVVLNANQIKHLFDSTDFDTTICVDELEGHEEFRFHPDGKVEDINSGFEYQYTREYSDLINGAFRSLVTEAASPQSDMAAEIIGLLLFAEENADVEDIQVFLNWLDKRTMLSAMQSVSTQPSDYFECANGKTWDEMEEYYLANRPKHTEPHW